MNRTLYALLLLPLLAAAAPVPKTVPKMADVFGEIADPKGECKFEMGKGGALTVTVPTTHPPREVEHGKAVAPLVSREVVGDFTLTVRIRQAVDAAAVAAGPATRAEVAVGVALTADDDLKTTMTLVHTLTKTDGKWAGGQFMQVVHQTGGGSGSGTNEGVTAGAASHLRLTRTGAVLTAESSADGRKWLPFATKKLASLGDVVRVGPVAFHSTDADFTATLDEYEIKPLPKAEKK